VDDFRYWLVRRIDVETIAFHNADYLTRDIRWGRVLGYLEVGVQLGYWSARTSSRVSDSIRNGRRSSVPRTLLRGQAGQSSGDPGSWRMLN
jgi:hypothetical protein